MKFIVDGMLGKLTRWLRMLGHNVKYSNKLDDAQLITIAKKERRILLTRDLELYQQAIAKGLDAFYLEGTTEAERLAFLARRFKIELEINMEKSRCPKCNTRVKPIPKEKVVNKVEKNTFSNYNEFWECPKCEKVYWQCAHWTRIRKTLDTAKENLKRSK
ncbi:MAG: Mut7-C RNAse domain-containing protein [Candidatus Bathyarchaeota archaeon]|nr:Mut7-C RNAse domain-containing protein [Candidatus Bathyarchaeota archaeon]